MDYLPVILDDNGASNEEEFCSKGEHCVHHIEGSQCCWCGEYGDHNVEHTQETRPWRTLIRIEEMDSDYAYVEVPGSGHRELVKVPLSAIPQSVLQRYADGHIRFHAEANIGADRAEDISVDKWEDS